MHRQRSRRIGTRGLLALIASLSMTALSRVSAKDWSQWCGSDGKNMVSEEKGLPESFAPGQKRGDGTIDVSTASNVKWGVKLGNAFYSTPSVAGGKIFVGGLDESNGIFVCFDASTGKRLWQWKAPPREVPHTIDGFSIGIGSIPQQIGVCSTAAVEGDRVYFVSNRFDAVCLDAAGSQTKPGEARVVWRFDMWEKLGVFPCDAANASPLIVGDLLYVTTCNGVDRNTFQDPARENKRKIPAPHAPNLIVLDKRDGRLVATDDAPIMPNILHGQWSSPSTGVVDGRRLVFFGGGNGVCYAFEALASVPEKPVRLKTVWSYDCIPPEYKAAGDADPITHYCLGDKRVHGTLNKHDGKFVGRSEIIATPVLVNDRVYISIGRDPAHGRGRGALHCIDARGSGDITASGKLWTYQGLDRTLSTVSVADGLLYVSDVGGRLHCLDTETGKCHWIHDTNCETWGSTLVADGKIYMPTSKGLWVLAAGKELKILAHITLGGKVYASPIVANGTMYVATNAGWLWAVEKYGKAKSKTDKLLKCSTDEKQPDAVQVTVPLLPETIPGAAADRQQTAVVVTCGKLSGASTTSLPPVADTHLWKGSEKPAGNSASVVLRDNRWSQGLLRVDAARLEGSAVQRAVFRFQAGGSERPGNARLQFHRMLVDWSENATWSKPFPDRPERWDGLRPGKDYETQPFAVLALEEWKPGGLVEAPGFEKAVEAWRDRTWPNYGFLVLFWGKSLQIGIPSREANAAAAPPAMTLGGPQNQTAVLNLDLALFGRLLPQPDDLLAASLRLQLQLKGRPKPPPGATLNFFRRNDGNVNYERAPFLSVPVAKADKEGQLLLPGLEGLLQRAGDSPELPLLMTASGTGPATLQVFGSTGGPARQPAIQASVKNYPRAPLLAFDLQPQPGVYCTAKDGHLDYGGRRLRLWGTVGYGAIERKRKMGFNCSRLWDGPDLYDQQSVKRGEPKAAANADKFDIEMAATRKLGMFVMYAGLTSTISLDKYRDSLLADDSFLAGGDDWRAWKEAVTGKIDQNLLTVFDERLARLRFAHAKNLLMHRNPLTGKRLGEEEAIAVYEVWNELGFVRWALGGGLDRSPQYFRDKARAKWNAWLLKQYADDAALRKAWGRLEAGESLAGGRVQLAPKFDQRERVPEARGRDSVRFWIELLDDFNQRFRRHCRALMPPGVGVNVAPFSFDTQYCPSIPWDYCKALGDVNCFGMYFWGIDETLAKPPSMYVIDSHTVAGQPTVLYETNQSRPCPFRSDYPQRIAALACWQDWDGVVFHYWGGIPEEGTPDECYLLAPLPHVNRSHYWSGVQHAFDPVMCSSMAIAGRMFLGHSAMPAPAPLTVDVGRKALFGFDTYNGLNLGPTTFARGARIRFRPEQDTGVTVDGRALPEPGPIAGAVRASPEIVWDWPHARLIVDTPTYKAYVGRTAGAYRFSDGLSLSDVNLPWVCFALASDDGRPLVGPHGSRRMLLSAVFDARNRGFQIDPAFTGGGPLETSDAIGNRGTAPVIADKPGYTLAFPTEIVGRLEGYDFALRKVVEQSVSAGNRLVCPPRELFLSVLSIERLGKAAVTPPTTLGIATGGQADRGPGHK